jgi:hypothetical protein
VDTITFPAAGDYTMWWEDCCRNCALLNMTNPCNESFHLYNVLHVDPSNSSPEFLNPPIPIAELNVAFNYNPLPFDVDGDSIAWQLDIPVSSSGLSVVGYTLPPSDSTIPFNMNPVTGEITFLPNTLGHFEVSVLVNEYRAGSKIGEIRRDMQIIVVPSLNKPCNISSSSNTFPYSGKQFNLNSNSAFSLTVTAAETDNNPVSITANGEPFILNSNPATATVTNGTGQASAVIDWTPVTSQQRVSPYIFALRTTEEFAGMMFSNDITFTLNVGSATGISEKIKSDAFVNVYPNPNDGKCFVEVNSAKSDKINITVTNIMGQNMAKMHDVKVSTGKNMIYLNNLNLTSGQYFITIEKNGKLLGTQKMEIK